MLGRLLRSADFVRVLAAPPRARSAHFALHHLAAAPSGPNRVVKSTAPGELSTDAAQSCAPSVDELVPAGPPAAPDGRWLGTVVPKRHAKRAVTRNLIKRQMRALMTAQAGALPAGLWVLRLKAPFDPRQFTSAASAPLRACARDELCSLLKRARQPAPARSPRPAAPQPAA